MANRKHQSRVWSLHLHGGAHLGAAAMANRARASMDVQHHRGMSTRLAFLETAGSVRNGLGTWLPGLGRCFRVCRDASLTRPLICMVLIDTSRVPDRGADTGASLRAAHSPRTSSKPSWPNPPGSVHPRDNIADITLQIDAGEPGQCAAQMEAALGDLTTALEAGNMVLSEAKQQVLGLTKALRPAWEAGGGAGSGQGLGYQPLWN